jgi:hypothetical protein
MLTRYLTLLNTHTHYLYMFTQYMTTNEAALARVQALIKKGEELVQKNHEEMYIRQELKRYHNKWFVTSHSTQKDDIEKVCSRIFD